MLDCIAPSDITEEEKLAYLDGEASVKAVKHIAECPACTAEVAFLYEANALLGVAIQRSDCPELDDLLAFQTGFLPKKNQRQLKSHIDTCVHCQAEIAQIATPLYEPLVATEPSPLAQLIDAGKRLIEAIKVTAPQSGLVLRGQTRQHLMYEAGDYQVSIALEPPLVQGGNWQVQGEITLQADPLAELEGEVKLLLSNETTLRDQIDEFGFFSISNVIPGEHTLNISIATDIVPIPLKIT